MALNEAILRYSTAKGYVQCIKIIFLSDEYKDKDEVTAILPMHMLAGFALELYLKAWLLGSNVDSKSVSKFGHDVCALYAEAIRVDLPTINGLEPLKNHLARPHADFTFRYLESSDIIQNTNWPVAFQVFGELDAVIDTMIGASASQGLPPGH